jgi:hypothetical protein
MHNNVEMFIQMSKETDQGIKVHKVIVTQNKNQCQVLRMKAANK